jgi:Zn finger protein HypA/HybF involved in hydrogenase expression
MNRKQRRAAAARRRKGDAEQAMADKVHLFGKIPKKCDTCEKQFDKKNKDMVFSWRVFVKDEKVRLFCPECISKTQEIIKESNDGT